MDADSRHSLNDNTHNTHNAHNTAHAYPSHHDPQSHAHAHAHAQSQPPSQSQSPSPHSARAPPDVPFPQQQQQASSFARAGSSVASSPSTTSGHGSARRRRIEASGDGCVTCRARKVKCSGRLAEDGRPCTTCVRLELQCSFVIARGHGQDKVSRIIPSQDRTEAGTVRKRAQRACTECHAHKTKCSSDLPSCKRCATNGLTCVYGASKRKFSTAPGSQPSPRRQPTPARDEDPRCLRVVANEAKQLVSPTASSLSPGLTNPSRRLSISHLAAGDLLNQRDLLVRHFQIWFKLWARLPLLGILHPTMTFVEIEEKRLNPNIGKMVCAVTARYLQPNSRELPALAEECARDVESYIMQNIGSFLRENGHENIIILLMMVGHFMVEQQMGKAWMFMSLAGRLITGLQLNWEGAGETPWEQESIRRTVWALWKLDRYFAGGFDEHLVLRDEVMHLRTPVPDDEIPPVLSSISPPTAPENINAHHIRLHQLKHQILARTKTLANPPKALPRRDQQQKPSSVLLRNVNQLQSALAKFNQNLPECLKVADQATIKRWFDLPECSSFFILHSTYWELHIDLYRFSVPGLREAMASEVERGLPRDFVVQSQKQAVGYAVCLSRFWESVQEIVAERPYVDGTERLITIDFPVIFHIIQSTKVLLAARQHRLFADLEEASSAPFLREGPVNDQSLATLIQSNMRLLDQYAHFHPVTVELQTRDLRTAVEEFNEYGTLREMPVAKPPKATRLPGPHYILEQAIAPPDQDQRHNGSGADVLLRQKVQTQDEVPITSGDMSNEEKPDIPAWLSQARGQQALPLTPSIAQPCNAPQVYATQVYAPPPPPPPSLPPPSLPPPSLPPAQPNFNSHSGNTWSGAPSIYHTMPSVEAHTSSMSQSQNIHLLYDRARGDETAAVARPLPERDLRSVSQLPGNSSSYYQRAGGVTLPFPRLS